MIDTWISRYKRTVGAAGLALAGALAAASAYAQFSAPYDPDFAPPPSERPAPARTAPSAPAEPEVVPQPVEAPVKPFAPDAEPPKPVFQLVPRADQSRILEPLTPAEAAPRRETGYSIERYQRVKDAVDRGEEPGAEAPASPLGPGFTAPAEVAISTEAPKPPPSEVELPTYGTSLSVTGRKIISVNFSEKRFARDQVTTGRQKTTNLIEIDQQLQLRMQGKVGPKITVNVDYDDTKENQQDISVVYTGDPNEVVQNVSFGDIDLSLPATEFVSYNKQLFGIRADVKYKGFRGTVIGSRTKGTTKSKQFQGNSQFVSTDFSDASYLRRQYYDVSFGAAARLPIRAGSERVVLARQDPAQTGNVNLQTLTVDDIVNQGVNTSSFTGQFLTLVAGQDYVINYAKGFIQFRNQLQPQFVVAVDYLDAAGNALSLQTSSDTVSAPTGSGRLKLIKTPSDQPIVSSATEAGWSREMKTVYSIGQTSIVRDNGRGNFILRVLDPSTRDEVGSGLNPPQRYPDTIDVDFENGLFQLRQPFSVSNSSPGTPDPELYAQTPISKRVFHVEYNFRFKTFILEPNLVVQSEIVILDGVKLNRNVDYFIDYEAGFVTFFNPDRISAQSTVDIAYEVAPFAGATNETLLGGRVSHEFNEHFALGTTLIYQAGAKAQTVPQVTELARSLFVYEFDSQIKRVRLGRRLTMTLQGEFAQSRQNLNLNEFALIDNMEGVRQEDSASTLASAWQIASNPPSGGAGDGPADPTRVTWVSEDFNALAINPNAQANANDVVKVLALNYDFSDASSEEASIVFPFSISGVDMSQRTILEVVMLGDNSLNQLNFHLGAIDENADGLGVLRTEDANLDKILQPAEDIGFLYAPAGKGSKRYGAGNGILDDVDLDKNGRLDGQDFTGGDFGYVPDPNNPSNGTFPDATPPGTPHLNGTIDFGGSTWRTLQIPLNISSATASRWTNIKQIRVSIKKGAGGQNIGGVKFARIAVVGNTWQRGQAGDPALGTGSLAGETLTVTPVNSVDNPTYTPIYNAAGDASAVFNDLYGSLSTLQKQTNAKNISEQALQLSYSTMTAGATVYTKRVFSAAVDISQHRYLNFLVFGNAGSGTSDTSGGHVFFLRAGSEQNYFEVQVPINFTGWRKIRVKQTDPGNGVMNDWVADTPGTTVLSTGAPSLQQVSQLVAGVYGRAGLVQQNGAVFLNEIHVAEPVTRVGTAHKLQADFEYAGWGTFGFKQKAIDRNFQTPTSVVSNQDRRDDDAYLNLSRLSWMPMTFTIARSVTDTPSTVQTGSLSNVVNLLQQGKVTTWNGAAQANLAYGAYPRLNLAYARNRIEYDLLTRRDDRQTYTGTMQYGVPSQSRLLPRTVDANVGRTMYDVRFESDFARAIPGNFDTFERGATYGGRLTFTPWSGSSFNPTYARTSVTERRVEHLGTLTRDSRYPKSFNQSMGFSSNYRLTRWLNPQVNYQVDTIENNILTVSTFVVGASTFVYAPGDIKTVNRSANGSVSLPIAAADIFPRSRLLRTFNVVSGYQLQDGDVWNNVDKGLASGNYFFVRQTLRGAGPAAQRANLTLRDTWNSTQRWSPLESYQIPGRLGAFRTLSISNNYVLSTQRSEVTGTRSKTVARTLPDAVASLSQLEQLWFSERWMSNAQMNFRYARRTSETVGTTLSVENSFGTDLRSLILKRYDTSISYNLRRSHTKDLLVGANTQVINHEDASAQVTFDLRKFRFTPKVDYTKDVTTLGTGVQSQNVTVLTPSVLSRADLALPAGLRLPGSARPLLFTNRIIWTTTASMAVRKSPVTVADNSRLASLNTSADYELAKNLRMTMNGSVQRLWHQYLPEESFFSYAFGSTLTFQF